MELSKAVRLALRYWVLIIVFTLVGVGGGALVCFLQRPLYLADAKVYISVQQASNATDLNQGTTFTQQVVKSFADVAVSPLVLNPVIEKLDLSTTPAELANSVTVVAPADTVVIDIRAENASPSLAANIANSVSGELSSVVQELTPSAGGTSSAIKVTTIQPATAPILPSSPRVALTLVLALVLGLVAAVLVIILRERLDTRLRSESDFDEVGARPLLGGVPFDKTFLTRPIVLGLPGDESLSESFRSIRAKLQFLDVDNRVTSLVVTSSLPGEGKSTTAANLAASVAAAGGKVLLVDTDLRRPRIEQYFGIDGSVGLTDVLIGATELGDALQVWGPNNLTILPCGQRPPNPSELLQSRQMIDLMRQFSLDNDLVIYDAPPMLPVSDAAIIGNHTSGVLLVAAHGISTRAQLKAVVGALSQMNVKLLGVVATMVRRGRFSSSSNAYGYGYGYEYSYAPADLGSDPVKPVSRKTSEIFD